LIDFQVEVFETSAPSWGPSFAKSSVKSVASWLPTLFVAPMTISSSTRGPIYYVAGPPAMVAGIKKMLVGAGVDEDEIRAEDFAGY
jgi:ferredoxin-NADP reductase